TSSEYMDDCALLLAVVSLTESPPPAIYTLSLHDALPIFGHITDMSGVYSDLDGTAGTEAIKMAVADLGGEIDGKKIEVVGFDHQDRKSTRLNSSHVSISYAVFCLKKKKTR